jgi:integrase
LDAVGKPIKQVTRGDVEQFLLAQTRDGRAPRTRNIYLASIRWLLRASGRHDVTALLRQARVSKALGTVLSGSDVEKLLVAITSLKHRAILMTAYGAGLRIGEVLALETNDSPHRCSASRLVDRLRKATFRGPEQVYRYLGRYTHRVAIGNSRLVSATEETVTFRTRGDQTAALPPLVFLSRFLQHVLPHGFVKIRHYGLLASGNVTTRLARARVLLGGDASQRDAPQIDQHEDTDEQCPDLLAEVAAVDVTLCPSCGAHAVQRGPLPSHLPSGARAPPQVAA